MNPLKLPLDHRRRLDCGEGQSGPGRADGGEELILAVRESTFEIRLSQIARVFTGHVPSAACVRSR